MIDWVYRTVAGLAPDADDPGYRTVHVAPRPAVGLEHASASIDTPQGRLAIDWRVDGGVFEATLEVPFGSRAFLDLPATADSLATVDGSAVPAELGHGVHRIAVTAPAVATPGGRRAGLTAASVTIAAHPDHTDHRQRSAMSSPFPTSSPTRRTAATSSPRPRPRSDGAPRQARPTGCRPAPTSSSLARVRSRRTG